MDLESLGHKVLRVSKEYQARQAQQVQMVQTVMMVLMARMEQMVQMHYGTILANITAD
jgi:hypothetical protein